MTSKQNEGKMTDLFGILHESHKGKKKEELISTILEIQERLADLDIEEPGVMRYAEESLQDLKNDELKDILEVAVQAIQMVTKMEMREDGTVGPFKASSTDFVSELNNIDFAKLLGGPLQAAITAQANASVSTIDFIQEVGFDDNGDIRKVEFKYEVQGTDANGDPTTETKTVEIPFLAMVNVPSIRIETVDVDFNVKLNSVESADVKSKFQIDAGVKGGWGPVKFKVSASYQRSTSQSVKVEREYTMNVKLKASQGELPAGLEKILGLLAA